MSDDLAKEIASGALRIEWCNTETAARRVAEHAADRIKQLVATNEELEAKLAKAVEALEVLSDDKNLDTSGGYYDGGCSIFSYTARQRYGDFDDFAHTTLTELTGGKDE